MDNEQWLKDTFIKETHSEPLFIFIKVEFTQQTKFIQLTKLLDNVFYTDDNRESILDTFCRIQRVANAVSKLKSMYRFKSRQIYNTDNLYMNPISPNDRGTLVLLQNNTKYVFHIRELIHSINSSLSHCCHFFAEPIVCKNPYTNIPFTKSALYNIYFAIKNSSFLMPTLFHRYFLCNFEYSTFCTENSEMINEEYLKTYVENYCLDNVYSHVRDMFKINNIKCNIHKSFPKDRLFEIMKPYLKLYFISNFSMNRQKKDEVFYLLHKKICVFMKFNPNFGKRKVKMTPLRPFSSFKTCNYYYDDNTVPFISGSECKTDVKMFMTSHLEESDENTISVSSSSSEEEEMQFDIGNRTPILYDEEDDQEDEIPIPVIEDDSESESETD